MPVGKVGLGIVMETYHIFIDYEGDANGGVRVILVKLVTCRGEPNGEGVEDMEVKGRWQCGAAGVWWSEEVLPTGWPQRRMLRGLAEGLVGAARKQGQRSHTRGKTTARPRVWFWCRSVTTRLGMGPAVAGQRRGWWSGGDGRESKSERAVAATS